MKKICLTLGLVLGSVLMVACGGGHSSGGGGGGLKLDSGGNLDSGGGNTPDMAMSMMPQPDLSMMQMGTLNGCNGALGCINMCNDPNTSKQCIAACKAGTTMNGWNLLITLIRCLFGGPMNMPVGACPGQNGGVCDSTAMNYVDANCTACLNKAQMQGGACYAALMNCGNDMP